MVVHIHFVHLHTQEEHVPDSVLDEIVREPVGGAHRDPQPTISRVGDALLRNLKELLPLSGEELKKQRTEKFLAMGRNLPE